MDAKKIAEFAQTLNELLKNEDFRNVALPKPNFWDIVHYGESSYENRYNRMFAWLLDPTANHGLGARLVNGLIDLIAKGSSHIGIEKVRTETETAVPAPATAVAGHNSKGRIDITVNDPVNKLYIALECKMGSSQHTEQLGRYRTWVQEKYRDYTTRHFVFLTEIHEKPLDQPSAEFPEEKWIHISYEDLQTIIEASVNSAGDSCPASARVIIEQFIADQRRRSAVSVSDIAAELFDQSSPTGNVQMLLASIEALEIEDSAVRAYARTKEVELPESLEASHVVREYLASAFEALGRTSSELDRVLATCWAYRPPMVDMSKDEDTIRIIKELAEAIAGQPIEPKQEVTVAGRPKFFKSVKISRGRQNVTLTLHDGSTIYFAGSNKNVVPAVLHHSGKDSAGLDARKSMCDLRTKDVRGKLAENHGGSGAKLADDLVAYLAARQESGDLLCGCGRHATGLTEH